jgi:hypothetical protein
VLSANGQGTRVDLGPQSGSGASARFIFGINVGESLAVLVADDEASAVVLNLPAGIVIRRIILENENRVASPISFFVAVSILRKLVGVAGFEPATPSSRTRCCKVRSIGATSLGALRHCLKSERPAFK